jgi:hypothetical protein
VAAVHAAAAALMADAAEALRNSDGLHAALPRLSKVLQRAEKVSVAKPPASSKADPRQNQDWILKCV